MFACHPHPPKGTRQLPSITLSRGALDSIPPLQGLQTWEEPIPQDQGCPHLGLPMVVRFGVALPFSELQFLSMKNQETG